MRLAFRILMVFACGPAMLSGLSGCSGNPPPLSGADVGSLDQAYRLDTNDKLRITVYNEPNLTGEYTVTTSGAVAFPLIGLVPVKDLTLEAASEALRARLAAGFVNNPKVSIEVQNYRPYYILGEINRPGQYPYVSGMTVQQAVAAAGGFSYRANEKTVFVRRSRGGREGSVNVRDSAVPVLPGDTIRIGQRYF